MATCQVENVPADDMSSVAIKKEHIEAIFKNALNLQREQGRPIEIDLDATDDDDDDDAANTRIDAEDLFPGSDEDLPAGQASPVPSIWADATELQWAPATGGTGGTTTPCSAGHRQPDSSGTRNGLTETQAQEAVHRFQTEFVGSMEKIADDAKHLDIDEAEKKVTELAFSNVITEYAAVREQANVPKLRQEDIAKKTEETEEAFWEDMAQKGFVCKAYAGKGNPVGSRWQRALAADPKLRANYGEKQGHAEQAKFRKEWFEGAHKLYEASKTVKTVQKQKWKKDGTMMTLGRIAWKEGGGAAGLRAAINIGVDCIAVGGGYWKQDRRAKNIKFMYFEEGYSESFTSLQEQQKVWQQEILDGPPACQQAGEETASSGNGRKRTTAAADAAGAGDAPARPLKKAKAKPSAKKKAVIAAAPSLRGGGSIAGKNSCRRQSFQTELQRGNDFSNNFAVNNRKGQPLEMVQKSGPRRQIEGQDSFGLEHLDKPGIQEYCRLAHPKAQGVL